ncbi:MAG: crotonase/enoyl-CoA hydratase family protein [Novosphingobium sp.]|nr:crotonase/enoyl-CoA hydratase family protein [Novosphingobium sp.]
MNTASQDNERVTVVLNDDGRIAHVTLNRPDKLNAFDPAMFDAIASTGSMLDRTPGLRCIVLSGGGRAFSAGLDLATFEALTGPDAPRLAERTHGSANLFQHAALLWRDLPVPVIAAIHGVCFGGALQLAGGADIRIVAPDARLSVMEMKWGLVPDMGGFTLWRGAVRDDVLRELTYTAREFSGEVAVTLGFATLADPDPLARAMTLAREIAGRSPSAIREAKVLFNRSVALTPGEILVEESLAQDRLVGSPNQLEAIRSQMEGRPAKFGDG